MMSRGTCVDADRAPGSARRKMCLRLSTLSLSRRSGSSEGHLTMSGSGGCGPPSCRRQAAAESSLRHIFVLPLSGVLHTALTLRQHKCLRDRCAVQRQSLPRAGGAGRGVPARRAGALTVTRITRDLAFGAEDERGDPATGPARPAIGFSSWRYRRRSSLSSQLKS